MKLLCVGDIHLGRQPSRLSDDIVEQLGGASPGPAAAWRRTVDYAVAHQVDGVLLAGDVVEQEDDFYEAYPDLDRGVRRLIDAGIRVFGVSGNHDVEVLPRLADSVDGFRLLGRDGRWEAAIIEGSGGQRIRVLGWSFPEPVVRTSPLAAGLPERDPLPTIGLLHCDRDQPGSRYAPVRSDELDAAPVDAWLLGHIHRPDPLAGPRPVGYLGSLSGLDPGESGARGPWLLELLPGGRIEIEQIALAPLRWETVEIDVEAIGEVDDLHRHVVETIGRLHDTLAGLPGRPDAVGCRLRFTGRTDLRSGFERTLHANDPRQQPISRDGIVYFIHDWHLEVLPSLDLDTLAKGSDPAGLLARRLIMLKNEDSGDRRILIENARRRLAAVAAGRHYATLGEAPPDDEQTARILESAALRTLDELLAQRRNAE